MKYNQYAQRQASRQDANEEAPVIQVADVPAEPAPPIQRADVAEQREQARARVAELQRQNLTVIKENIFFKKRIRITNKKN